jgi:hypothetical protein
MRHFHVPTDAQVEGARSLILKLLLPGVYLVRMDVVALSQVPPGPAALRRLWSRERSVLRPPRKKSFVLGRQNDYRQAGDSQPSQTSTLFAPDLRKVMKTRCVSM